MSTDEILYLYFLIIIAIACVLGLIERQPMPGEKMMRDSRRREKKMNDDYSGF